MPAPSQSDAILSATQLKLSFGNQLILDEATLAIGAGEKIGLVGRNGCGKSSFLRILAEEEKPDDGHISRRQGLVTGYLPQEFEMDEDQSVEANIRAGAAELTAALERFEKGGDLSRAEQARLHATIDHGDGWNLDTRIETLMRKLEAPPEDREVRYLSGGEKRRVGLCRALAAQPDLLLLDEPTNHLDTSAIEWLEAYIAGMPGSCVFVTHDRYFLDHIATRVVELAEGRFFSYEGNYSDYLLGKAERIERQEATEQKRQRFLRREVEWVRAGVKARGTKQRSRLENYYAVSARKAPERELDMELIIPTPPKLGNVVADLEEVTVAIGEDPLFYGFDLSLKAGECVGIVGPNGAGKTSLLRVIMGDLEPVDGTVTIGKRTEFNYVDQTRFELNEDKSVFDEVGQGSETVQFGEEKLSVRAYLRRFLFTDDRINDRIGSLSGGEKNRVLLAKILRKGGNVLILDEPTNDLDLQTLRVIEEALINFPGAVLVVSHDRWFLDRVSNRVIVFDGEGGVSVNEGNYSYFLEKKRSYDTAVSAAADNKPKPKRKRPESEREKPRKLKWKEARELEGMEGAILEAETAAAGIEEKLNDPDYYRDHAREAAALSEELETRRRGIERLYARWEELEAIRLAAEG